MRAATIRGAVQQLQRQQRPPLLQGLLTTWRHLPLVLLIGVALTATGLLWVGLGTALGPPAALGAGVPLVLVWAWGSDRVGSALAEDDPTPDAVPAARRPPSARAVRALALGWPVLLAGSTAVLVPGSPVPVPLPVLAAGAVGLLLAGWITASAFADPDADGRPDRWREAARRAGQQPVAALGMLLLLVPTAVATATWGPWLLPVCLGTVVVLATAVLRPGTRRPETRRPGTRRPGTRPTATPDPEGAR